MQRACVYVHVYSIFKLDMVGDDFSTITDHTSSFLKRPSYMQVALAKRRHIPLSYVKETVIDRTSANRSFPQERGSRNKTWAQVLFSLFLLLQPMRIVGITIIARPCFLVIILSGL